MADEELGSQSFETFNDEQIEILRKYCTNPGSDVFIATLPAGLNGAAYARYSRASGGWHSVVLKEFVDKDGKIKVEHADDLIKRILVSFGDDSVGEFEGAHVSVENISNVTVKRVEDGRIGVAYIEQSSRYVVYDQRDTNGNFRYLRDQKKNPIMQTALAEDYVRGMDWIFEIYCSLVEPMKEFYKKRKPIKEASHDIRPSGHPDKRPIKLEECVNEEETKSWKRTYNTDMRTKTCDTLRILLPAATLTNLGMFCNGRAYEYMAKRLLSSSLPEDNIVAEQMLGELRKIIPHYVARASRDDYLVSKEQNTKLIAEELFKGIPVKKENPVYLHDFSLQRIENKLRERIKKQTFMVGDLARIYWEEFDLGEMAQMAYPYVEHPFRQIIDVIRGLPEEKCVELRNAYIGNRHNRRNRPGRALEYGYSNTFDLIGDLGIFRDMHRMRMMQQIRQYFTTRLGFTDNLDDFVEAGHLDKAKQVFEISQNLYERVREQLGPEIAQYPVVFGANERFMMAMNDREQMHTCEIRTTPQGHPNYRKMAQQMHALLKKQRTPWRAEMMKFVDYNDYFWSRAESEARQRQKERKLGIKSDDE